MEPGSALIDPFTNAYGVQGSRFEGIKNFGMLMYGVSGYTNINNTNFYSTFGPPSPLGVGLDVTNGALNITNSSFNSHGPNLPSLHITNASVNLDTVFFNGSSQPGYSVFVEGTSNGTVLNDCGYWNGVADNHYIRVDGSSILINNNTFNMPTGQLSVIANDLGDPGTPILRNPNPPGTTFDNTTMNATGVSSVTLQWFKDVYVEDPDGNFIPNAPVRIKDRLGNPALPSVKITNATGWARGIIVTELIQYLNTRDIFNPFNISAESASMFGYVDPEETISQSIEFPTPNTVIVPFSPTPNTPPTVSSINLVPPPPEVQSGLVTIEFMLDDPDIGDDGNMSVLVEFWDPIGGMGWTSALLDILSDPTTDLNNNTLYTVYWVSNDPSQLPDYYDTGVDIRITPYDRAGAGTPSTVGPFTLDNRAPDFLTPPTMEITDTTAWINWTVNESAEASVWYGFTLISPVLTTETIGSSGSTFQSVQLTALQPGRSYTFIINSTDPQGNKRSSDPITYTFKTEIRIQLYKGWNMISFPPYFVTGMTISDTLASIVDQYDAVQAYQRIGSGDLWKHYREGKPYGNDLLDLDIVHGFWIHMKNDAVLIPAHDDPTTDIGFPGYTQVILGPGWNFVGYPSVADRPIDDALLGVPYDMMQTYDESSGKWLRYNGMAGTLIQMEMGKGYWIHGTTTYLWEVYYV